MKKVLLKIIGTISLGLGIIGIVLPILPTTPFLLLSLTCYAKSSDRLYNFVLSNKYLAPYVEGFISDSGIPVKIKIKAISMIWIAIGSTVLFFINKIYLRLMLLMIASVVSLYIWTRNTPENE